MLLIEGPLLGERPWCRLAGPVSSDKSEVLASPFVRRLRPVRARILAAMLSVDPHPSLDLHAFTATLPGPLGSLTSPEPLLEALRLEAAAPLSRSEELRAAVRDLLRRHGIGSGK